MPSLYFKNISATGAWGNPRNWFTNLACTVQAANAPWVAGDATYLGYDLARGTDSLGLMDGITLNGGVSGTGTCDISGLTNAGGTINGGTFTGANFANNYGYIDGGTFTGANFANNGYGFIYGGTFSGAGFTNSGFIYSGTFTGSGFTNSGNIYGGTFTGANFATTYGGFRGGTFTGAAASYTQTGNTILAQTPYGVNVQLTLPQLDILGGGLL